MSQIRVLHVLGALNIGGAESMVMNLYRNIDREKVQFDFVIHTEKHCDFTDEILALGGKIYSCPRYVGKNHFQYCKWWKEFLKEHREYHIVHGHVRSTASLYLAIAKKLNRVTIAHSHSTSNGKGLAALVKDCMQFPIRYIVDYMFACSEEAGKWLFGRKAIVKTNFKVVANGINLEKFAFNDQIRERMRKQLSIELETVVLGHVGRFTKPKNHIFLINVFEKFQQKVQNSKLLLVGEGELFEDIKKEVKERKLDNKVLLVGNQINTQDYYQVMDVFAFPSLWEGLGMVAIEAMANGLTVIASDRVPREIKLTDQVFFLSLEDTDEWVQELVENSYRTSDGINREKMSSYDIKYIAKEIQNFYISF